MKILIFLLLICKIPLAFCEYIVFLKNDRYKYVSPTDDRIYSILMNYQFPANTNPLLRLSGKEKALIDANEYGFIKYKLKAISDKIYLAYIPTTLYHYMAIQWLRNNEQAFKNRNWIFQDMKKGSSEKMFFHALMDVGDSALVHYKSINEFLVQLLKKEKISHILRKKIPMISTKEFPLTDSNLKNDIIKVAIEEEVKNYFLGNHLIFRGHRDQEAPEGKDMTKKGQKILGPWTYSYGTTLLGGYMFMGGLGACAYGYILGLGSGLKSTFGYALPINKAQYRQGKFSFLFIPPINSLSDLVGRNFWFHTRIKAFGVVPGQVIRPESQTMASLKELGIDKLFVNNEADRLVMGDMYLALLRNAILLLGNPEEYLQYLKRYDR